MRIAAIDKDRCMPQKCQQECVKVCPINREGEKCCWIEGKAKINEALCVGCGLCVKKCPFSAITVVNTPEQLKEEPLYRFGENGFMLFRLPFPISGEVTGIIGENGIGKSTAMKILSGEVPIQANLFKMFRGTELQQYLEAMKEKKIKVMRKPQNIDSFTSYKMTVDEIVDKADERGIKKDVVKILELENALEKHLNELSGGELQRVIIACASLKQADVYYFDEPTSYLDVYQRMRLAHLFHNLLQSKAPNLTRPAIMIVDHDLAFLDAVADKIHIFYGVPGAYGIVSKPYGVRVGINMFLDGFIKEDNVRIRAEPINFLSTRASSTTAPEVLVSWVNIVKKYPGFELYVKSGNLLKGEVLGIFGANTLGKTTFAKILAGIEKQDNGEVIKQAKISYKPQYISIEMHGSVRDLLATCADIYSEEWRNTIALPLKLEPLYECDIEKLSGGELQRVAIAAALSRPANVYLFDEPSAFLDVEQRILVAKLIRRICESEEKSALIIDHDLLFLSYISDRAMVFRGESGKWGCAEQMNLKEGFNVFLKDVGITFRRDPQTGRPRANKPGSQLDMEQKQSGNYFYL